MVNTLIKKHLFEAKVEIQGEIGKGQTGTVLYGYDRELQKEVAIKIYHSQINGRLIRGQVFIEKSKPLLRLDHPNLIKIFHVEEEDDTPIVFMEFFDAPNLQHIIHDKGPMSVQDMLMRAREIAEVLVHIHFQGIIHGSLHPGHVLVGPQGQIKIIDLGFPWILMDMLPNCDEELFRPLPYLPPEIAKEELLEVSSDLYCLGIMMYEMLTGTVPYADLPKTSIMGKLAFDQADPVLDFPAQIPEAVCDLIRQMTRNKSIQRLRDTTHVLTIINQQLAKLPLSKEKEVVLSTLKPIQSQAPPPKEDIQPEKPAPPSTHSQAQEPAIKKETPFQRPQSTVNYARGQHSKIFRTIGMTLSLIVLIGIAGILGYWYRDFFEPHILPQQTQPDKSSQKISLPQVTPLKSDVSITPDKNTPINQKPLQKKDTRLKGQTQSLPIKKEIGSRPQSNLTPQPHQSGIKPDKPVSTQPPRSLKTKQGNNLWPTKKQPDAISQPSSGTPQPAANTTASSKKAPLTPKASRKAPPQQPRSQPPKASNIQQKKTLAPTKKQSDAISPPSVTRQSPPAVSPMTGSINRPLRPKVSKNGPRQQPLDKTPKGSSTQQDKALASTKKQTDTTSPPTVSTTTGSNNVPQSPKAPKTVLRQQPTGFTPTKETIHPETKAAPVPPASEEIHDELTDEEIESILQALDDPAIP